MSKAYFILLMVFMLFIGSSSFGQFSANNILEVQRGNLPNSDPADMITVYDQLNLKYRYNSFSASTRLETFQSLPYNPYSYTRISQATLSYRKKGLNLKAGHYYETLGRGLLLWGYEIKNSIFEDRIYRSRQGFYKDILGVSGSYRHKNVNVKALWGKTLNNQLPQEHPESRIDEVAGTELSYQLNQFTFGGIYLNHQLNEVTSHFTSAYFEGNILNSISFYGELAKNVSLNPNFYTFGNEDQYGAYFNLNYSMSGFGISIELKDYQNFIIGSGIADAPTLVKEQSYRLLNRSTHVTEFFDETGYQLEIFYNTPSGTFFTFNHSLAKNNFGSVDFGFYEFFLEAYIPKDKWQLKTFIDFSTDEVKGEKNRIAAGAYYTHQLAKGWAINMEIEGQNIERNTNRFNNAYIGLYTSKSTKFSAGFQLEVTDDPFLLENEEILKSLPGVNFSYKINNKNSLQLFAGNRRGGPACTSGICYEVLDFKGVELRYTLKL